MTERKDLVCPVCGGGAEIVSGKDIYPLAKKISLCESRFWRCVNGCSYVGCHPRTHKPLGTLATADMRWARMKAHEAFDVLWRDKGMRRPTAYRWLAGELGLEYGKCHIGSMDIETCRKVVEAVEKLRGGQ